MDFIISQYSYIFLASTLVSLLAAGVTWRKHTMRGMYWLILAMLAIAIWNFFGMLDISSLTLDQRIIWSKLEYLGANTTAPLFMLFFLNYPHRYTRQKSGFVASLFILPLVTIILVMLNETHFLFWTGFEPIAGTSNGYIFHHGVFYFLALAYNYMCGTIIMILIFRNIFRYDGIYRLQLVCLFISGSFPFAAGLIYSFGPNPFPELDILPIAFAIGGLGIVLCVFFLRMFDIVPVGRNLLIEKLQDGVIVLDYKHRIVDINPAARRLLKNSKLKVGDSIDQISEKLQTGFDHTSRWTEIITDEREKRHLQFIPNPLVEETGHVAGYLYVIRDVTDIRDIEQALQQSQERYRSLIEDVVDVSTFAICILDEQLRLIWENQAAMQLFGNERDIAIGSDARDVLLNKKQMRVENSKKVIGSILESYRSGQYLENVEIHFRKKYGRPERWMMYSSKPIRVGYYAGGRIEQLVDITEQKRLQNQIERLAITDELTGIYNRRGLFELGTHDFDHARRMNRPLSAIYLDIDYFKQLNDRSGHANGDHILVELTRCIQKHTRDMDTFARYGGDEFVILIPDANLQQASEVAERIRTCMDGSHDKKYSDVTISLGVAELNKKDTLESLLDRADLGMYRAKQNGRNRVEII
jgi:diguanylate cyclase (GGDEF)-like protein/PAS domain S-box-containing protein